MAPPAKQKQGAHDFALGEDGVPADDLGFLAVQSLVQKGFCSIANVLKPEQIDAARTETDELEDDFYKVHRIIREGIMGQDGTVRIADVDIDDEEDEEDEEDVDTLEDPVGENLKLVDAALSRLGQMIAPYTDRIKFKLSFKSTLVLTQTRDDEDPYEDDEDTPLIEKEVMKWQNTFLRHRVMGIVYLGPGPATIEVKPFDDSDVETHDIPVVPGSVVLLRPDLMSHNLFADQKRATAASCFFMTDNLSKRPPRGGWAMTPAARELDLWCWRRLGELKAAHQVDDLWDPDIPEEWCKMMNHTFTKSQFIGVSGISGRNGCCDNHHSLFQAFCTGPDYAEEVPLCRWDHNQHYDPSEDCWKNHKTNCKHCSTIEGLDLFDCKFFSLSPNESKSLDPHHRQILELGYMALYDSGLNKKKIMNSYTGTFVAQSSMEWSFAHGLSSVSGVSSFASGRFSFCLGVKGPSLTLHAEDVGGMAAVSLAAEGVQRKGTATPVDRCVGMGVWYNLSGLWWHTYTRNGDLNPNGRCQTFSATAQGYIRADAGNAVLVQRTQETVDGEKRNVTNQEFYGVIAGAAMHNVGASARLGAPHGPAQQQCICEAIKNAGIQGSHVDSTEAHGAGHFIADAVEVSSYLRSFRNVDSDVAHTIKTHKTSLGHGFEGSGVAGIIQTLLASQWAYNPPIIHLRQANPHLNAHDEPLAFPTEITDFPMNTTFNHIFNFGPNGTQVSCITFSGVKQEKRPEADPEAREAIHFWPAGGGSLEDAQQPLSSYTIVGSFSNWGRPTKMKEDGEGIWSYTLTLGENKWEKFQIWLDGDSQKVLHPDANNAAQDAQVLGPDDPENPLPGGGAYTGHKADTAFSGGNPGMCWMIDGRRQWVKIPERNPRKNPWDDDSGDDSDSDGPMLKLEAPKVPQPDFVEVRTIDAGIAGDQYKISLHVRGKWRTVTWRRVVTVQDAEQQRKNLALAPEPEYFVSGAWAEYQLQQMTKSSDAPGSWYLDIKPWSYADQFSIVRNRDWEQVIYPMTPCHSADEAEDVGVCGPDGQALTLGWVVHAIPGETVRIEFQRSIEMKEEKMAVTWRSLDGQARLEA